jgi:phosphatidylglycerophosphate synthase
MLARLRPFYNQFVVPLGKFSASIGLTPDFWTFSSLLISMFAAYLLSLGLFWWGLAAVLAMFAADAMDGATARATGCSSRFGTVLDHSIDRYAEFFVIGGLLVGGWISPLLAMFTASGVVMASYVRAKAESAGGLQDCTVGIAGRAEKLFLTYGAIILMGLGIFIAADVLLWIVGIISHITAIQRLLYTRSQLLKSSLSNQ